MSLRAVSLISVVLLIISLLTHYILIKLNIIETMATNGVTTEPKTVYDFTAKDIDGNDVSLEKYRGSPLIIVNVASNCGLTKSNYKELNEIYEKFEEKGLKILAFPCNQFLGQEPGPQKSLFLSLFIFFNYFFLAFDSYKCLSFSQTFYFRSFKRYKLFG